MLQAIEMAGFAHQASTWTPHNMAALERVVAWVVSQYPIAVIHPPARSSPNHGGNSGLTDAVPAHLRGAGFGAFL